MIDDAQLLRRHVEDRSEAAFAELVQRHLGLVYHAAARQLGSDAHLAADVTQGVFLLLAQRARGLLGHPSLAGWLHTTTRFKVGEALRAERRRRARESAAQLLYDMHELNEADGIAWERLRPVIDEVLSELDASDREAVLLRYFEQQPYASVAVHLRITEAAAHKRVERALDKLRQRLGRRGVTSTAVALAAVLGAQTATAAPTGLAATVTSSVLASSAPLATAGMFTLMSTKTTVTVTALAVMVAGGLALRQAQARSAASAELAALTATTQTLSEQVRQAAAVPETTQNVAATAAAARPRSLPEPGEVASREESRAFLREHPELRAAFAAHLRAQLLDENAELISELGLSEEQAEHLVAVLAKGRTLAMGQHQFTLSERDFSSPREFGDQIRAVIGETGYQKYREIQRQVTARSLARDMTKALYATPMPLTATQASDLRRLVNDTASDPALGKPHTGHWWYLPPDRWARLMAEAAKTMPESHLAALREAQAKSTYQQAQSRAYQQYLDRLQAKTLLGEP